MRLAEAQQLLEGLNDSLLRPALEEFFAKQKEDRLDSLVRAVRQNVRDTMKEANLAGQAEVYEHIMSDLERFAERSLREVTLQEAV